MSMYEKHPMPDLKPELHQFNPAYFGTIDNLREAAATGAQNCLLIACSDHGTAPDSVSSASPNQFFFVQVLGASIPPVDRTEGQTILGSVQYAIGLRGVEQVIVCGHLGCRVVQGWMNAGSPRVDDFCDFGRTSRPAVENNYSPGTLRETLDLMVIEHTLFQLENLQTHDSIQSRLQDGRLRLHCWIADDASARVFGYCPLSGQLRPLESAQT